MKQEIDGMGERRAGVARRRRAGSIMIIIMIVVDRRGLSQAGLGKFALGTATTHTQSHWAQLGNQAGYHITLLFLALLRFLFTI